MNSPPSITFREPGVAATRDAPAGRTRAGEAGTPLSREAVPGRRAPGADGRYVPAVSTASGEGAPLASARLMRWLSLRAYGLVTSALFGAETPPRQMRDRFERFARVSRHALQRRFPGLVFEDHRAGDLLVESVRAVEAPRRVVLHLHGGGFFMGSPASYRNRAMRLSYRLGAEVFVPAYRLAPEHPYPAALDDALAAFRLVRRARAGSPLFVSGDSAGGGLALSLLLVLRDLGEPTAAGAILLSPWTDLTASGHSVDANEGRDLWFSRRHLEIWAGYYAGSADPRSPYVSAAFGDPSGLPALLLLAAEDELLLDDARRVHEAALHAGGDSRLLVGARMQHDWPLTLPWLAESKHAWREMQRFVEERTHAREE